MDNFLLLGLIYFGSSIVMKYPIVMAGYNTMPEWKKEKTDIKSVERVAGQTMPVADLFIIAVS